MDPNQINKAPVPVIVIAWLVLLGGVVSLLGGTFFSYLGIAGGVGAFTFWGIVNGLIAILWIILSFGLRKMKSWAMYLSVVTSIVYIISEWRAYATNWITVALSLLAVIYLLSIRKKFS